MVASQKQIEANRRNSLRSTGPRTEAGKEASRRNALTHGLTAEMLLAVDGEDEEAYARRVDAWLRDAGVRDEIEAGLIRHAATLSWKLDRADRHETESLNRRIRAQAEIERAAHRARVLDLRARLIPGFQEFLTSGFDAMPAAALVREIESTADGCRWLLECWGRIRQAVARNVSFGPMESIVIARLSGHGPGPIADPSALDLIIAGRIHMSPKVVLDADHWSPGGLAPGRDLDLEALHAACARRPENYREACRLLNEAVDRAVARLEVIRDLRDLEGDAWDAAASARFASFDPTDEAERLRRHQAAAHRGMLRSLDSVGKRRLQNVQVILGERKLGLDAAGAEEIPVRNEANPGIDADPGERGASAPCPAAGAIDGQGADAPRSPQELIPILRNEANFDPGQADDDVPRPGLGEQVRAAGVRGPGADHGCESKTPHPAPPRCHPAEPGASATGIGFDPSLTLRAPKDQDSYPASPPSPRVQGEGRLAQTNDGPMADASNLQNEANFAAESEPATFLQNEANSSPPPVQDAPHGSSCSGIASEVMEGGGCHGSYSPRGPARPDAHGASTTRGTQQSRDNTLSEQADPGELGASAPCPSVAPVAGQGADAPRSPEISPANLQNEANSPERRTLSFILEKFRSLEPIRQADRSRHRPKRPPVIPSGPGKGPRNCRGNSAGERKMARGNEDPRPT